MKLSPKCPFYDIEVTQIHAFLYWKEDKVLLSKIHGKTCEYWQLRRLFGDWYLEYDSNIILQASRMHLHR